MIVSEMIVSEFVTYRTIALTPFNRKKFLGILSFAGEILSTCCQDILQVGFWGIDDIDELSAGKRNSFMLINAL